ncbi:MAG TPA: response regulator, partial [Gemmatimonadaceae bacterium]
MSIAARLTAVLGLPLAILVALGIFTGVRLADIEGRSRLVGESQIRALATLGNLSRSFAELRVNVRTHLLATSDARRADARARFTEDERDVRRLLQEYADGLVLDDVDRRFLTEYVTLSGGWMTDAKQVMDLEEAGRRADALLLFDSRMTPLGFRLSEVSNKWIAHVQQTAKAGGLESIAGVERLERQMLVATIAAVLLTGLLGLLTARRIVTPVRSLDATVRTIAAGDYAKTVPFVEASDETGSLARSIDVLKGGAAEMDEQRWVKSHASTTIGELQKAATLPAFGERLLSTLVPILGGGVAAFYVFDGEANRLQRVAAYGLADTTEAPPSIPLGDGLVGLCAQVRKSTALTDLPPDYLRVASSLGHARPARVTALPAVSADVLLGVLEVASFRAFDRREQALLDELLPAMAMSLDILQRNLHTQELLEQTRAQGEQLQRINFQADTALELTKAGYWHVPIDGSGWYNSSERAARIFGDVPNPDFRYQVAEWAEHVREGDEEAWRATMDNFTAAVEGRIPAYSAVYAYKRPVDGDVVWIRALGKVVRDDGGTPTDMFGVTQDITAFKRLERDLVDARRRAEEATEVKSMFLANMSHEIRTPMNAIIGLSHLALKTSLTAKQRDYVSKIHGAGTSLLAVINDILDFSKIEAGRLDIESTEFGLDDVIASVTMLTAHKAHDKGLELLAHVQHGVPERLVGDPLRLGQILTNLVNNAVKFTEHGEVRLTVERLEDAAAGDAVHLRFAVRDTGIGMSDEQAARLFQPFTQADMSVTRKHGGTGLGLTISRRLVELMGGRIWLESQPGAGTTFYFTVRLGLGTGIQARNVVPERLDRIRALVVDDNATARDILHDALATVVRRVDVVASGKDAITAVRQHDAVEPYDILFMDWRMPGMDGLQASRQIKADETLEHQPAIVLVTAFGRDEVREEAQNLQLDGFLVKPVTKSTIVDTLVNVFAGGAHEPEPPQAETEVQRLRGARILLTEDNAINQQIAIELLQAAGATVDVAGNGREAVDILSSGPPTPRFDVVLMDLQMPEMDGFQATTAIRADRRFATLPIIAMTAHATAEERQRCLEAGMNDHIPKPIDPDVLIETIARFFVPPTEAGARPPDAAAGPHAGTDEMLADLPEIDGFDAREGLARVGGNRRLYRDVLRQFVEQQGGAVLEVGDALAAGDARLAERIAHSLKGVAGNIGAMRVHAAAGRLEKEIRDRASSAVV